MERIRTLEELNTTIMASIEGYRVNVEVQLAEQAAIEAELQRQLEESLATPTHEPSQ